MIQTGYHKVMASNEFIVTSMEYVATSVEYVATSMGWGIHEWGGCVQE